MPSEDNTASTTLNRDAQPQPLGTPRELTEDRLKVGAARRFALISYVEATVGEKIRTLRDNLGVIVTITVGSLALLFSNSGNDIIKTKTLFFSALVILALAALTNIWSRIVLIRHREQITYGIESNYLRFVEAARIYLLIPSQTNLDTLGREDFAPPPLADPNMVGKHGYLVVAVLTGVSIAGLALSLMFTIT